MRVLFLLHSGTNLLYYDVDSFSLIKIGVPSKVCNCVIAQYHHIICAVKSLHGALKHSKFKSKRSSTFLFDR